MTIKFGIDKRWQELIDWKDRHFTKFYPGFPNSFIRQIPEGERYTTAIIGYKRYKNKISVVTFTLPLYWLSLFMKIYVD